MRINKENAIGLVIDVQENKFNQLSNKETFLKNTLNVINGLKILGVPLIVTQQNTEVQGATVQEINQAIGNFSYIEKSHFSCYREPAFIRVLNRVGKRNVVIVGTEAHICIMQTALDLIYNNFNPVVVADAIDSVREEDRKLALWRMRDVGAVMATTESILFELCRETGIPEYEQLVNLLRK